MKERWLRPWVVVLVVALLYVGVTLARHGGDPLALALVGSRYGQGDPQGTEGYDGQFSYFIARDPLHGWQYCDAPAYRTQRILYPLLAWALALGRPEAVGWTLIAVNLAALAGGTWATERLLVRRGVSRWYALGYGLYGGLLAGLRLDLTEPLAMALLQGGLLAGEQGDGRQTADVLRPASFVFFALAVLTKETSLVAVGGVVLVLLLQRRWRPALTMAAAVGLPFLAWQGLLWVWLGQPGIGSGGAMATPFEIVPFAGLLRVAAVDRSAFWLLLAIEGPLFVLPVLWALVVSLRDLLRGRFHPWVGVLLAQAAMLTVLPFSTWREPLAMARLASGLVAATILYGALRRSPRILRWSLIGLATLALLVNESGLPV